MVNYLKFVVAGPKCTGKTLISNFIAGNGDGQLSSDKLSDRYDATIGCRVLEFEISLKGPSETVNIELWDASGDHLYEGCWRGIMADSDAVILVYNPDAPAQDQQIGDWFEFFVKKNGLKEEQCMIFAHRGNQGISNERFRPPPLFSRVTAALTTPQSGQDIKQMFENFVKDIHSMKQRK